MKFGPWTDVTKEKEMLTAQNTVHNCKMQMNSELKVPHLSCVHDIYPFCSMQKVIPSVPHVRFFSYLNIISFVRRFYTKNNVCLRVCVCECVCVSVWLKSIFQNIPIHFPYYNIWILVCVGVCFVIIYSDVFIHVKVNQVNCWNHKRYIPKIKQQPKKTYISETRKREREYINKPINQVEYSVVELILKWNRLEMALHRLPHVN